MAGAMAEARCPRCGKAAAQRFAPFCSTRCQQVDLGRWLKGDYVIPAAPGEAERPASGPEQADDDEAQ
jgi:endogenous inhibitor of DNA gyrase (YacG/DUF329 family)